MTFVGSLRNTISDADLLFGKERERVSSQKSRRKRVSVRKMCRMVAMLVCALAVPSFLPAQHIVVSEELILKDDLAYEVLGVGDRTVLFRDRGTDFEVRAYDANMQLRRERVLEWERRNADLIEVLPGDGIFHALYGYRHRGDYTVMHRSYGPDLALIDTTVIHVDVKEYFTPKYRSALSEDKSKVLLYQTEKEDEIFVIVYSLKDRKSLLNRVIHTGDASVRRNLREVAVADNGDVFLIFDDERLSDRNRIFNVMRIDAGASEERLTEVHLGDLVAADMHYIIDNTNQRLVMAGLFNEKASGKSKGLYLATVGMGDGQFQLRTTLLSEELLLSIYGKEVSSNKGVTNFTVVDIVLREDGGALLIAEMAKEYSRRPNLPGRRDFGYPRGGWVDYYYEDLIAIAMHPNGDEHWNTVLHKKQYSQDDDAMYSSYFLFRTPEKIRLLFNDEIRQENMVSEYVIRGNGYHRRQSVFSTDYQRLRLRLRDAVQVAYNMCVVPSERSGRLSLVKITFEDDVTQK